MVYNIKCLRMLERCVEYHSWQERGKRCRGNYRLHQRVMMNLLYVYIVELSILEIGTSQTVLHLHTYFWGLWL